tara:strand:+ start:24 stop:554 length:531 start_codon:yes stop_codon:yes gene_type:complete
MKLYIKQPILSQDDVKALMDAQGKFTTAGVYRQGQSLNDRNARSASIKQIHPKDFPQVNEKLIGLLTQFDPKATSDKYYVKEYNYLIYNVGDHFKWHRDVIKAKDNKVRRFSTTTVLSLSDDLEGGDFGIKDGTGFEVKVNLQERDTLLFESNTEHQVYPVTKGKRVVLVAWIYDK